MAFAEHVQTVVSSLVVLQSLESEVCVINDIVLEWRVQPNYALLQTCRHPADLGGQDSLGSRKSRQLRLAAVRLLLPERRSRHMSNGKGKWRRNLISEPSIQWSNKFSFSICRDPQFLLKQVGAQASSW